MSTAKEIYDRKKRLKQERLLRDEEAATMQSNKDLDAEILLSAAVVAMENIALALSAIASQNGTSTERET